MHIRSDELLELFRRRGAELKNAHLPRPAVQELDLQSVRVPEVTREAFPGTRAHRLDADLDPARASRGPLLDALRTEGEVTVIHVPDRQCQGREALEVVPAEVLLTITEIDGLVQFTQLRKRVKLAKTAPFALTVLVCGMFPSRDAFQSR